MNLKILNHLGNILYSWNYHSQFVSDFKMLSQRHNFNLILCSKQYSKILILRLLAAP
jgi:hypothetical protein